MNGAMVMQQPSRSNQVRIEAREPFLRVHFADGAHADFHYFWLRHNCDCCRHPQTGERTLCSSEVPMDLRPASVTPSADGSAVSILWDEPSAHRSDYRLDWLREHAYALNREDVAPPASDVSQIEMSGAQLARRPPCGTSAGSVSPDSAPSSYAISAATRKRSSTTWRAPG